MVKTESDLLQCGHSTSYRGGVCRKEGGVNWSVSERRDCRGRNCMTEPHGGVQCRQTSTPHRSETKVSDEEEEEERITPGGFIYIGLYPDNT